MNITYGLQLLPPFKISDLFIYGGKQTTRTLLCTASTQLVVGTSFNVLNYVLTHFILILWSKIVTLIEKRFRGLVWTRSDTRIPWTIGHVCYY